MIYSYLYHFYNIGNIERDQSTIGWQNCWSRL